ncbi:MAG: PAS domain-containing protein [Rhodopseudomonas sp.]|uniref:helix-turn-helix domain-containing protein n=1 Tax=Rhodopseudomonas sp. TaxID=1078 RepID=UPI0017AA970F|nr:PAS domain-containing protein [Rhodopseudomonas sp.]NVN84845.1 PAS domain-containing protein [Rhodopseudomonas sp.]
MQNGKTSADQAKSEASGASAPYSLAKTAEQSQPGFLKVDPGTLQITFANQRFCQMIGYTRDELIDGTVTFRELTHPDDLKQCEMLLQLLVRGDIDSYSLERRYLRRDKSILPTRTTITTLDRGGGRTAVIGVISTSAEHGFGDELALPSAPPDGASFWTRDLRSNTGTCSDGLKIVLGLDPDGPAPTFGEFLALVHPHDRPRVVEEMRRVAKGMFCTAEHRIVRPTGQIRWVSQSAKPLFDVDGEVMGVVGVCLDITDERSKPRHTQSDHTVETVKRYVDLHWDQPLNVAALAEEAGVTARTLFKHCQLAWGFTPNEYIKRVRLNRARAILEMADRSTTVLGTALKCCFQNAGHFARDYRLAFGERPSDTLERARKQCRL